MTEKVPWPFSLMRVESSKFVSLEVNDIPGLRVSFNILAAYRTETKKNPNDNKRVQTRKIGESQPSQLDH